ncbi:MAG: MoxR family ATPase [Dehalococcoidales bacterium]|nr:MoxR family ATPase [Dehalococcoidales bacterium]
METKIREAHKLVQAISDNVEKVIIGKRHAIELALVAFLSHGHLLIEDSPGVGKTMFARSLARSFGTRFKRIQFTPDLLPSDITGVSIFNQKTGSFEFHPGPILSNIVLADEINRATPKTQSALLECMEEHQITVDGATYKMPHPFHIIATLNPLEYEGTFPLPETQLDRFLIRLDLGYPSVKEEITIMERQQFKHPIEELGQVVEESDLTLIQEAVKTIYVDQAVKQYIALIVEATRRHQAIHLGASPRGSLALFRTSQSLALIRGRDYVLPDDIKALAEPVLAHRLVISLNSNGYDSKGHSLIAEILERVAVPGTMPGRK